MTSNSNSNVPAPFGFDKKSLFNKAKAKKNHQVLQSDVNDYQVPEILKYESLLNYAHTQFKPLQNKGILKIKLNVKREPNHKTSFNIVEIGKIMNRNSDHVKNYIFAQLGTTGNVNAEGKLTIMDVFLKNDILSVIRKYVESFVICRTCESTINTYIVKEKKLYYISCKVCGGKRHVANYKDNIKTPNTMKPN